MRPACDDVLSFDVTPKIARTKTNVSIISTAKAPSSERPTYESVSKPFVPSPVLKISRLPLDFIVKKSALDAASEPKSCATT